MNFAEAMSAILRGAAVAREGWNGKAMFVQIVQAWSFQTARCVKLETEGRPPYPPFVAIKAADGKVYPWQPSQQDMLASDWWELDA